MTTWRLVFANEDISISSEDGWERVFLSNDSGLFAFRRTEYGEVYDKNRIEGSLTNVVILTKYRD